MVAEGDEVGPRAGGRAGSEDREGAFLHPDDQLLIQRFLDGDAQVVAEVKAWVERAAWPFRSRLFDEWEDLCQELLMTVTRIFKRGRFRGDSRLRSYLGRVVISTCMDRLRSRSRWQWLELDDRLSGLEEEIADLRFDRARFEDRDLIRQVLRRIDKNCKKLWMMIAGGLSYTEMSQRLGAKSGTLRVKVNRCRQRAVELRDELLGLAKEDGEENDGED